MGKGLNNIQRSYQKRKSWTVLRTANKKSMTSENIMPENENIQTSISKKPDLKFQSYHGFQNYCLLRKINA